MDAHEWNESLDRIISTIAEMIDLLKNESRRWATSPIFSTPLPSPASASPPPTSATEQPSPASAIITPPALPLKTAQTPSLVPVPKSVRVAVTTSARKSASSLPKPTLFYPPPKKVPLTTKSASKRTPTPSTKEADLKDPSSDDLFNIDSATGKREWRPPWRLANTSPNTIGRFEWRPPWRMTKSIPVSP
ncbi:mucin-7-like [Helianthus annuus]|uniref:mucin-7-like n=1 Tax=Helianthus annuus TaxID=4232 RepID=UPI000B908FF2|nr:mucin-7-like [Helianthus annuus]